MNNRVLKVLAIIFAICTVALVGYIVYDKVIKEQPNVEDHDKPDDQQQPEDPTEPETPDKVEEISLSDVAVKDLIDKYSLYGYNNSWEIYTDENVTEDYIPDYFILGYAGAYISANWDEYTHGSYDVTDGSGCSVKLAIPESVLDRYVEYYFGDVSYKHATFTPFSYTTGEWVSDPVEYASNQYSFCIEQGGGGFYSYAFGNPYKAETINDGEKINIYVKTIFVSEDEDTSGKSIYEIYRDYNSYINKDTDGLLYRGTDFNYESYIDKNIDKLNGCSYVYTFKKQSDGYYLSGFKQVD